MNRPNISDIHNCYGCGVCSRPCPVHIIDLRLNDEGFYEPYLTEPNKCTHCGLCRDVCAYVKDELAQINVPVVSYAAWSNDKQVRKKCSSGGVGFEIAKYLLGKGYKTVGVRYNAEKGRAEHFVASTLEELVLTTGSKYIQSYPVDGWKGVDRKGKYLVTGTPCQIDSFRNYMKRMKLPEENFILMDFFCHGVPSMLAWKKYCKEVEKTTGSKYIQSYPVDGWKGIDRKGKYLVTGTPCQIDSFRNYMKRMKLPEENFILMDFFCHGVPSMLAWKKYCQEVEKTTGKITYASWRNKLNYGWHDSWIIGIDGEKKGEKVNWHESYNVLIRKKKTFVQSRFSQGDKFFRLFLCDQCLGQQCYFKCKYKYDKSSADIRIGDLWGKTYQDNEDGVSGAIAFNERGKNILENCNCTLTEHPFEVVAEGQMKTCPEMKSLRAKLIGSLQNPNKTIDDAIAVLDTDIRTRKNIDRLKHPARTLYHIAKCILNR